MTQNLSHAALVRQEIQEKLEDDGLEIRVPLPTDRNFLDFMDTFRKTHPAYAQRLVQSLHEDPALDDFPELAPENRERTTLKDRFTHLSRQLFMRESVDGDYVLDKRKSSSWAAGLLMALAGGYLILQSLPDKAAQAQTQTSTTKAATADVLTPGDDAANTDGAYLDTNQSLTDKLSGAANKEANANNKARVGQPNPAQNQDPFADPNVPPLAQPRSAAQDTPPAPPPTFTSVNRDPFASAPVSNSPSVSRSPRTSPAPPSAAPHSTAVPQTNFGIPSQPFTPTPTAKLPVPPPAPQPKTSTPVVVTPAPSQAFVPDPFQGTQSSNAPALDPLPSTGAEAFGTPEPAAAATPGPTASTPASAPTTDAPSSEAFGSPSPVNARSAMIYQAAPPASGSGPAATSARPKTALVGVAGAVSAATPDSTAPNNTAPNNTAPAPRSALMSSPSGIAPSAAPAPKSALVGSTAQPTALTPLASQRSTVAVVANALTSATAAQRPSAVMYSQTSAPTATPSTIAQATNQANSASPSTPAANDAPTYTPTQLLEARLVTAIYSAAGQAVPVVVQTTDGNMIGQAVLNAQMARVQMTFNLLIKGGKSYPVQALAYQNVNGNLVSGVSATIKDVAPNLAADLIRSGINGLSTYAQQQADSGTTTVAGGVTTNSKNAPDLLSVLRGQMANLFALPQNQQSFVTVGQVPTGTSLLLMIGIQQQEQTTP